jgi:hypothetical protein
MGARGRVRTYGVALAGLVLLAAWGGCRNSSAERPEPARSETFGTGSEVVTATVRHIDLEGGFYGLETDDGRKLDPVNLPEELRKEGLRLQVRIVPLQDRISIRMWGTPVRILAFERL